MNKILGMAGGAIVFFAAGVYLAPNFDVKPEPKIEKPPETVSTETEKPQESNSKFAEKINEEFSEVVQLQLDAKDFSTELQNAMGLTQKEIEAAEDVETKWELVNYIIATRNFCYSEAFDTWVILLYAYPKGPEPGWSNIPTGINRNDWVYVPHGTGTILVPKAPTAQKILNELKASEWYRSE